ncbi:SipW-dependent-type signal peptide-containing protein [Halorubrum tibetense]|uniref:SipW-dependent-type signal peptide-containing protein n=1 Tax=Halorubrum tibetense TaxID=175631 RepID=A0ABD5SA78_9EURY
MDNDKIGLSRRKMLVGLGAVGVASAGAGLGTTAFFSDEESFQDNTITAGQFELMVSQTTHMVDQDGIGPDEQTFDDMVDDSDRDFAEGFLDITDAKPGDSYKYCWDPCVKYNPGYIQITLSSEETAGNDNGVNHVDADGLLGDFMLAVVTLEDQNGDTEVVFQGTLGQLVDEFAAGGLVHAVGGEDPEYCHQPCELMEGADGEPADAVELCVYLYLPSRADVGETVTVGSVEFGPLEASDSPGNAVQGAIFEGDVHFEAEQCRHNETPFQNDIEVVDGSPE